MHCPVCHCPTHKHLHQLDGGKLLSCSQCGLAFFSPWPTPIELQAFYESGYHDRLDSSEMGMVTYANNRYSFLKALLERYKPSLLEASSRTLLDIGCGTGTFLAAAQRAGWQVAGTEITQEAVELANHNVGKGVMQGDILELDLPPSSISLITSYHVIEHLLEPVAHLRRCHQLLTAEGILFLETPNLGSLGARIRGKRWSHIIPPEHLLYFSPRSLEYALHEAGFEHVIVFSSAPQTIKSVETWPLPLQKLVGLIYSLAPRLNLGAALNAIAFR